MSHLMGACNQMLFLLLLLLLLIDSGESPEDEQLFLRSGSEAEQREPVTRASEQEFNRGTVVRG